MIVATAGHIDHGKTALVKALTGVDTDRLPEEKARGISIDLGFAYWKTPAGATIGFVDVPGHERFVRNMLAGVCGIDYVMLVVAADDGVMPQTTEHLHIVDLLSVTQGVAVITKADRVSTERVDEVVADARQLLGSSGLSSLEIAVVSSLTGQGIADVRGILANAADRHAGTAREGRNFRYAIDRAFSVAGSGTVVTGTVFDGAAAVGDRLTLSPTGISVRIRGIQKDGVASSEATAGERCALNLTGVDLHHVGRGHWLVAVHAPTQRIDVRLRLLAEEVLPLKHWSPVHLHLGTADVGARVAIRRGASIAPGISDTLQLVTDKPIAAVIGDRFIIRDQSATRTIGGGVVIDPFAPARRSNLPMRTAQLEALASLDPAAALPALLASSPGGVDLDAFGRAFNLTANHRDALVHRCDAVVIGREHRVALPRSTMEAIKRSLVDTMTHFHRDAPQAPGMDIVALRSQVAPTLSVDDFSALLRSFAADTKVEVVGSMARLTVHVATANRADEIMWQRIKPLLDDAGFHGLPLRDLALASNIGEASLRDFLHRKAPTGEVVRVAPQRFYPRGMLAQLAFLAQSIAAKAADQQFTAAQFRDASGVNRTVAIEILECLDRLGITQRIGDVRKMRRDFIPILGPATAPLIAARKTPVSVAKRGSQSPASSRSQHHPFKG